MLDCSVSRNLIFVDEDSTQEHCTKHRFEPTRADPGVKDALLNHPENQCYVCHELTPTTRVGLSAGVIDVVLAHDVPELARATLKLLVDSKSAMPNKKQSSIVPFAIYTSENI
jgi:hypothetical protein